MTVSRSNQQWLQDLMAGSTNQSDAIDDLRTLLLRASQYTFNRNLNDFWRLGREEILQLAQDCAQDALIAVLDHLQDFRGDSKFSTWAYKFAINISLMAARREKWKGVSLDELPETGEGAFSEWLIRDYSDGNMPEQSAMQSQLVQALRKAIEQDLTDKQRQVLNLMIFNEVPMDEVVRYMGTNRNSVYKLLHDARRKLKGSLQSQGFEVDAALESFAVRG